MGKAALGYQVTSNAILKRSCRVWLSHDPDNNAGRKRWTMAQKATPSAKLLLKFVTLA